MTLPTDELKFRAINRRELLKLSPVLLVGAFAIPNIRDSLLRRGLKFSDWASAKWFRKGHLAPTFPDSEVTPFERFPYNTYDVDEREMDLGAWTLTVAGEVKKPGEYTLAQIQALPHHRQNTRHVCVEGWDVVGSFGGARISDFLELTGGNVQAQFLVFECADDLHIHADWLEEEPRIFAVMAPVGWAVP